MKPACLKMPHVNLREKGFLLLEDKKLGWPLKAQNSSGQLNISTINNFVSLLNRGYDYIRQALHLRGLKNQTTMSLQRY